MNIKEIRILNLFNVLDESKGTEVYSEFVIFAIEGTIVKGNFTSKDTLEHWKVVPIQELQKIPITEKWLLDHDFTEGTVMSESVKEFFYIGIETVHFHIWTKEDFFMYQFNDGYDPEELDLKYVHQLQNIIFVLHGISIKHGCLLI